MIHGSGNGFVLLDTTHSELSEEDCRSLALRLCAAEGMDGLIAIVPASDADVGMLFINSDGSVGEMCGNGARCLAKYAVEHGLASDPANIRIRTDAGLVRARRVTDDVYEVRLNDPSVLDPHRHVVLGGAVFDCFYTELGDPGIPHAVVFTENDPHLCRDALRETGRALRHAREFPRGANVSFVRKTGPETAKAVTYERGVEDFTLACGTGCGAIACAYAVLSGAPRTHVTIEMPGGTLDVSLINENGKLRDILLTGPAVTIGEGEAASIS